jgi:rRNA-processing protein FCF1
MQLPAVAPIDGTSMDNTLRQLTEVRNNLSNMGSGDWSQVLLGYQRWASTSAESLGYSFDYAAIEYLITTRRHWWLMDRMPSGESRELGPAIHESFRAEQTDRKRVFDTLIEKYRAIQKSWGEATEKFVVPDTNFFLHHEVTFDQADWESIVHRFTGQSVRVIVPIAVVRELDRQKIVGKNIKVGKDQLPLSTRARHTVCKLKDMFEQPANVHSLSPVVRVELLLDPLSHRPLPSGDAEIIERCLAAKRVSGKDLSLLTGDAGMMFTAKTEGLAVINP